MERMKKYVGCAAAFALIGLSYYFTRLPQLPSTERAKLVAGFRFEKVPLHDLPDHPPFKSIRQVHPSLARISAWVSSLGAAATLADLDGDGLSNDLIHVDPRTDLVTIIP